MTISEKLKLHTSREVMQAFLDGYKLINSEYGSNRDGEMFLYMAETGCIAEEDGAGAKAFRVPILMRTTQDWWEILDPEIHGRAYENDNK